MSFQSTDGRSGCLVAATCVPSGSRPARTHARCTPIKILDTDAFVKSNCALGCRSNAVGLRGRDTVRWTKLR